jgi:pseudouridine kinase
VKITVIGGANVDICGCSAAPLRARDSNPAQVHLSGGGVARNIAANLARLGAEIRFISAIGDDGFGKLLRASLVESGLDDSALLVREGAATGLYLVLLEPTGEMFIAVNDMAVVESLRPDEAESLVKAAGKPDLIVADANLLPETLEALAHAAVAGRWPLMADAVSVSKAGRLRPVLSGLSILKANRAEAAVLAGFPLDSGEALREGCRKILSEGVRRLYVTLGEQGSCCASGNELYIQPTLPAKLVNVNGAGDSFAAGAAYGFCLGHPVEESAVFGAACASLTVESDDGVSKALSRESVVERIARYRT